MHENDTVSVSVTLRQESGALRAIRRRASGEIMAHYTARTADQAEAAFTLRLKFEANPGRKRNAAFPSRKIGHPKAA
jgi:hypothetical protein